MEELTDVTRAQVAAAMIAVVAERGEDYVSHTRTLMDTKGEGCIQGEMLAKLGYPFKEGTPYGGSTPTVMQMLGLTKVSQPTTTTCACGCGMDFNGVREMTDPLLAQALQVAQYANDSGQTWGVALEVFEGVLAGDMSQVEAWDKIRPRTTGTWTTGAIVSDFSVAASKLAPAMAQAAQAATAAIKSLPTVAQYPKVSVSWNTSALVGAYTGPLSSGITVTPTYSGQMWAPSAPAQKAMDYSFA